MTYFLGNWRFWAGVLVSVAMLALLVLLTDLRELARALREANYLYIAPAVAVYFIGQYFRAARWQYMLSPIARIPVGRLFVVVNIGYMANNVLPARLGEVVRAVLLAQREQEVSVPSSIATLSVERLYDGLTLLAIAAVVAPILLLAGLFDAASVGYRNTAIVLAVGMVFSFALALVVFTALATSRRAVEWLLRLTAILPARFRPLAGEIIVGFVGGLGTLNSPRKHAILFASSLPVWFAEFCVYLIVAYSFNLEAYFPSFGLLVAAILLTMVTSNLITAIPAAVGGVGPFEVVAQQTLVGLGVGAAAAASYAVVVHLVALWMPVNIAGLLLLWRYNLSLRRLTALPEEEPATSTAGEANGAAGGAARDAGFRRNGGLGGYVRPAQDD